MKPRDLAAAAIGALGLSVLYLWESRRPAREAGTPRKARAVENAGAATATAAITVFIERPLTTLALDWGRANRVGLLNWFEVPAAARTPVALLFLDYAQFAWHALSHRVPLLWRWHRWHHADEALDASTGARVHPVETLRGVPWRIAAAVVRRPSEPPVQR